MGCGVCKEADLRQQCSAITEADIPGANNGSSKHVSEQSDSDSIEQFNAGCKNFLHGASSDSQEIMTLARQAANSDLYFKNLWSDCAQEKKNSDIRLVEECEESLSFCLEMIEKMITKAKYFRPSILLAQFALKLIVTLSLLLSAEKYEVAMKVDKSKVQFADKIKKIRKSAGTSMDLKRSKLPLSTFNFELTRLEIGIMSIHDPNVFHETIKVGSSILMDLIESISTRSFKVSIFRGIFNLINIGVKKAAQCRASNAFAVIASSGIPAPEGGARWTGVYVRLDERK
jgi:hypothetical protein